MANYRRPLEFSTNAMDLETVAIPTLLTVLGVLIWNSESSRDSTAFRIQARKRMRGLPDRTRVNFRLAQIGRESGYENFRIHQCSWALMGTGICLVMTLMVSTSFLVAALLSGSVGIAVFLLIDRQLTKDVDRYRRTVESEFAAIVEMLTLALSAGETPLSALTRISRRCHGVLALEFGQVIDSVRAGKTFYESLDALGRRLDSVLIRRFVDSLVTAMVRGAPLVEVLQRHAAEARQNQRNILMDKAGKAELSMMVPVVFLILPISVLFALWPSLTHLNLFAA